MSKDFIKITGGQKERTARDLMDQIYWFYQGGKILTVLEGKIDLTVSPYLIKFQPANGPYSTRSEYSFESDLHDGTPSMSNGKISIFSPKNPNSRLTGSFTFRKNRNGVIALQSDLTALSDQEDILMIGKDWSDRLVHKF